MKDRIEQVFLGFIAIFSLFISGLDWFGWLPASVMKIPNLTLFAVGTAIGYLVLERKNKLDRIENLVTDGTERIIHALDGVDVRRFSSSVEFYEYVVNRMREAKKTIDDLTFAHGKPQRSCLAECRVVLYKIKDLAYESGHL